ncbi:hypothetical protein BJ138DRAFT_64948 [Hygrophoropsis aurantiaca]|uniref:Uncharacterized protein n=1 Tax=Hygrophoropsis aurantiaca TaxID=72124 RepID=A0ACB8ACJ4_9AGAM|nr:hypothetical protein BJ138DRAFT_64948 [Hygrophoropsis aurantiaca]
MQLLVDNCLPVIYHLIHQFHGRQTHAVPPWSKIFTMHDGGVACPWLLHEPTPRMSFGFLGFLISDHSCSRGDNCVQRKDNNRSIKIVAPQISIVTSSLISIGFSIRHLQMMMMMLTMIECKTTGDVRGNSFSSNSIRICSLTSKPPYNYHPIPSSYQPCQSQYFA